MSMAKQDSSIEVSHLDTFNIQSDPLFYHVNGKDRETQDIEATGDFSIRLKVHFSTLQVTVEADELADLIDENNRLRLALGEPLGVLSEYVRKAYIDSLPNDITDTLAFKQSYFEKRIASEQAKIAESRLILKSVVAEQAKRRMAQISPILVEGVDRIDRSPLTDKEQTILKECEISRINHDLAEAQVYGDRMRNETICLKGVLEPFAEAFHDWLERPKIEENADFGDWIRQYLKKKNNYICIRHWFERAAAVMEIEE